MAEGGSENQTLKDNWDDAEGYYRELLLNMGMHMEKWLSLVSLLCLCFLP